MIRLLDMDELSARHLVSKVMAFLAEADYSKTNSEIMGETWKLITRETGQEDPYAEIKKRYNRMLLDEEEELRLSVKRSEDPLCGALRLEAAGNQIDFAGSREVRFVMEEVYHHMNGTQAVDDSGQLFEDLKDAKSVLYIGDNCGEIVLDKLFIEEIRKQYPDLSVTYGVRGEPIVNDVTILDARMTGMERVAEVIENGSGALGTVLSDTSLQFRNVFEKADVIISKGQGNFESLSECTDKNIYHLMMVKCERIAGILKAPVGELICCHGVR
ncbi:hypothetical protein B5E64_04040 [Drancourtella sp. An12]|nr:hypothetical protein B5E64_04040 [Drancourtella sp. An12]